MCNLGINHIPHYNFDILGYDRILFMVNQYGEHVVCIGTVNGDVYMNRSDNSENYRQIFCYISTDLRSWRSCLYGVRLGWYIIGDCRYFKIIYYVLDISILSNI